MRYEILGPLRVDDERGSSPLGAQRLATLLAVLLIRSDQVVPAEQISRELWGEAPPHRTTATLYVCISRLRKFLDRPGRRNPILTRPGGYMLCRAASECDADVFERLVAAGRKDTRSGQPEAAAASLDSAMGLWRGAPLANVRSGPLVTGFRRRLDEMRIECSEMFTQARLDLGRHEEVIAPLRSLVTEFPLREIFYRQLMLALFRSDRKSEALGIYDSACRVLDRETGLEPGRDLRQLRHTVLASL
ncbi:BTAD domain-containing putative transcriptional regulator [Streptomyces sp. NPDC020983]|uniref:AfsR/SARP family transcriptional regulator n=1 Tax=Streptomyces sp. NPDC020983 TaxID=3365106 RepID=UPI0037B34227